MSFLKNNRIDNKVPPCRKISIKDPDILDSILKIVLPINKCPELLIGKNSVIPCNIPNIINSKYCS